MKPLVFNGISIYRNAIKEPKDFIEAIETLAEYASEDTFAWQPATVMHADGSISESTVRTNELLNLPTARGTEVPEQESDRVIAEEVHKSFKPCIADFCARYSVDADHNAPTAYQILKYRESQYYIPHLDDGKQTRRRVSAVGYLNDNFEGGELNFPLVNFTYYPMAGDVVVFPSGAPFTHEARPVKQGIKYSIVNWWM